MGRLRNALLILAVGIAMSTFISNVKAENLNTDTSRFSDTAKASSYAAQTFSIAEASVSSSSSYSGFTSRFGYKIPNALSPYFIKGFANGGVTEFINLDAAEKNLNFTYSKQVKTAGTMGSVYSRHTSAPWLYPVAGQNEQPHVLKNGIYLLIPIKNSWKQTWANGVRGYDENFALISGPTSVSFPHSSTSVTYCVLDPTQFPADNSSKNDPGNQGDGANDSTTGQGDDVNVTNGNMYLKFNDFAMRGRGIPTEIVRTYNSQSLFDGPFGYGWTYDYSEYLKIEETSVTLRDKQGALTTFTLNPDGSFTSPKGKRSRLAKNFDGSYSLTTKNGIVFSFNPEGKLAAITDRNGNSTLLSYLNGKLDTVTDSASRSLRLSYIGSRISAITDPAGRVISYDYNSVGNLIKVTDPAGGTTQYAYDANHNMITVTNANGASIHFTYDDRGRCTDTRQDNNIQAYSFVYHPESSITEMTDGNGHKTSFHYDAEKGVNLSITDAQGGVTVFTWDENINRTSITAPNGAVTKFTYDENGSPLTVTNPMNKVSTFTYEPEYNLVTSITNPMSQTTSFDYDNKGNPLSITNAMGGVSTFSYDGNGNLISMKAPNGAVSSYEYDAGGYITGMIDAMGTKSLLSYDILGNLLSTTDAKGNSTAFTYDTLNRLVKVIFPPSTVNRQPTTISYAYDPAGNRLSSTDQNGNTTNFAYDTGSRLIKKTDPMGFVTEYIYDSLDNLLTLTDPNSGTYQYAYNPLDRVVESVSPIGSRTKFSYDSIGNVIAVKDANGNTISYDYDLNNKLLKKSYPDGDNVSYIYDAIGNRISMTDSLGTNSYSYDGLNRLTAVDGPNANDTISYSYNIVGNRFSMTDQDGGVTNYSYDLLNRMVSLIDPKGKQTSYSYDNTGNLLSKLYPNGIDTKYSYDNMNRLSEVTSLPVSYSYKCNPAGMRTEASFGDSNYKYAYDRINRLISETLKENGSPVYVDNFMYDAMGNRFTALNNEFTPKGKSTTTNTAYSHNADNSLLKAESIKNTQAPYVSYNYDANGNMLSKTEYSSEKAKTGKITTYEYDYENRLVKIDYRNGNDTIYVYNGDGKRVKKIEGNKAANYLYDGMNVIIERDEKENTVFSYTRGVSKGGGIGGIISMNKYSAKHKLSNIWYYHYDGGGNVVALTNEKGKTVQTYSYDAYGNLLSEKGNAPNRYLFSTKEYDSKAGLYYFGARYYDPETGRWTQKDPLSIFGGSLNLYQYCSNNPVNFYDPYGYYWFRQDWQEPGKIGRVDSLVEPKGPVSQFIEKYVPAGYTFGEMHDAFVDAAKDVGVHDLLANIPSMLPMYGAAQVAEMLRTLKIIEQQQRKAQLK